MARPRMSDGHLCRFQGRQNSHSLKLPLLQSRHGWSTLRCPVFKNRIAINCFKNGLAYLERKLFFSFLFSGISSATVHQTFKVSSTCMPCRETRASKAKLLRFVAKHRLSFTDLNGLAYFDMLRSDSSWNCFSCEDWMFFGANVLGSKMDLLPNQTKQR